MPAATKRVRDRRCSRRARHRRRPREQSQDLTVAIPHHQLTVRHRRFRSGKSTLAFDIVFAEGQRRFMESMSPYARQFVEQLPRPAVDRLTGIPPTVAIEQRVTRGSRKSTVATITEWRSISGCSMRGSACSTIRNPTGRSLRLLPPSPAPLGPRARVLLRPARPTSLSLRAAHPRPEGPPPADCHVAGPPGP